MRSGILVASLALVLAGCVHLAAEDAPVDEPVATAAVANATVEAMPPANVSVEAEPPTANATVLEPDPCALPVHGLDHECIMDGFHFGEAVLWAGSSLPGVDQTGRPDTCGATSGCRDVTFSVSQTEPGARLRVDAQIFFADPSTIRPLADASFVGGVETELDIFLYPPGADLAAASWAASGSTLGAFAESVFVGGYDAKTRAPFPGPELGTWTLRLTGLLPQDHQYRLRAALEAPAAPTDARAYPDLRIIPPFEVGFMVPTATFQPGLPTGAGPPVAGCMAEEYLEAQQNGLKRPTLCLRFSMGFFNAGDGAFRLKVTPQGTDPVSTLRADNGLDEIPMVQSVCTPDGHRCSDLPAVAGLVTRYHNTHLHYHYQNAYVFDLYRVQGDGTDEAPEFTLVGTSGKLGIDPASEAIEGWSRFYQLAPSPPVGINEEGDPDPASKRLQAGWGDVYDWNRAGNYVDFPMNGPLPLEGDYVLRGTTDPAGHIVEMNETNNVSFTHFRVSGLGKVEILQRGYGTDPWDLAKHVFDVTP